MHSCPKPTFSPLPPNAPLVCMTLCWSTQSQLEQPGSPGSKSGDVSVMTGGQGGVLPVTSEETEQHPPQRMARTLCRSHVTESPPGTRRLWAEGQGDVGSRDNLITEHHLSGSTRTQSVLTDYSPETKGRMGQTLRQKQGAEGPYLLSSPWWATLHRRAPGSHWCTGQPGAGPSCSAGCHRVP